MNSKSECPASPESQTTASSSLKKPDVQQKDTESETDPQQDPETPVRQVSIRWDPRIVVRPPAESVYSISRRQATKTALEEKRKEEDLSRRKRDAQIKEKEAESTSP
jgi:hypothetical protein